jgi:two-component system NarL family response regulator
MTSSIAPLDATAAPGTGVRPRLRILLADDHRIFQQALRILLEADPGIEVVAQVSDGGEVLRVASQCRPDVVCMDIGMPRLNGIEATRRLIAAHPEVKVIGLSAHVDRLFVMEMLDAGAAGYVAKSSAGEELLRAIRVVCRNQSYLCSQVSAEVVGALRDGPPGTAPLATRLTSREREVLQSLAEGNTSAEIAERLFLATSTVEVHRRNIMRKLDLHNVAELTKYAIRERLTSA